MIRLTIVMLCAGLMGSAMAADADRKATVQDKPVAGKPALAATAPGASGGSADQGTQASPAVSASKLAQESEKLAPESDTPGDRETQAEVPASAVPSATSQPPNAPEARVPQAGAPAPKSSIPLDKRKGGDVTKCLELGSNQEIAACADKHR